MQSGRSDNPEARAVERAIRSFEQSVRDHDVERVQALTTADFFKAYLQLSGSASTFAESSPELALGPAYQRRIQRIDVNGETARVEATIDGADARNVDAIELRLVRRDGIWLLDGTALRKTDPPDRAHVVEVTMRDHLFVPDPLFVRRDVPVVFRVKNAGAQPHMVGIWKVPPDAKLILVIEATEGVPEGVERIVQSVTFAPGDEGDITVARGFKPGRYMLTCFLSDITSPELVPHYDLGMLTEFEVK